MKRGMMFAVLGISLFVLSGIAMAYDVKNITMDYVNGGNFTPGDTPGFPLTISQPGSYRLMENIIVPANKTALKVTSGDVTIDLNGFSIIGPAVCSGDPLSCSPLTNGDGIYAYVTDFKVANGTVRGMSNGIYTNSAMIDSVRVISNMGDGIISTDGMIRNSKAEMNGGNGITVFGTGTVTGCIANGNGISGIQLLGHGTVTGSVVTHNKQDGIISNDYGTITYNTASDNGYRGIEAAGSVIGNSASSNGDHGIAVSTGLLSGNTSALNTGYGLYVGPYATYINNTLVGNYGGSVTGSGFNLGGNLCHNVICP